jgi:prepilin-type N-terminal cleavage/methylation domain-containing protein
MISAWRCALRAARTRRLARSGKDGGFTLAEMLCAMLVLGMLMTAVSALFIADMKSTETTNSRVSQANEGRVAMESMSRILRTAVLPSSLASCSSCGATAAFIQGTAFKVSFYADINNDNNSTGPSQVVFKVDANGTLIQTVQPADPGSGATGYTWTSCTLGAPGCSLRQTVLATGVVTSGPNLFTYYSFGSQTPITGVLTAQQLANVDAVDIVLSTTSSGAAGKAPVTFVQRIALPNVDTVIEASQSAGSGS